jgi:hypothetical protein
MEIAVATSVAPREPSAPLLDFETWGIRCECAIRLPHIQTAPREGILPKDEATELLPVPRSRTIDRLTYVSPGIPNSGWARPISRIKCSI